MAIDAYLADKKNQLDSIADIIYTTEVFDKTEIHPFIDKKLIECLNLLPEQFADFRDNYAISQAVPNSLWAFAFSFVGLSVIFGGIWIIKWANF